jgi:3-methyladenine DNA glycosylase AlkD
VPVGAVRDDARLLVSAVARASPRTTPVLRRVRRAHSRALATRPGMDVLRIAAELLARHPACPKWIAYELVHHHTDAMRRIGGRWLGRLGRRLASWGEVDAFAVCLLGPSWREGRVPTSYVLRWARSRDRWRRRAALVSTVALNSRARGGSGDPIRTLAVCNALLDDRDDMVVKAMSWALRELARREPGRVERYVTDRERRLAARVRREVRAVLVRGRKRPLRAHR